MSGGRQERPSLTTFPATIHPHPYRIQWERMQRWRERAVAAVRADDEPFDFLLVLFTNIFQMRDWIVESRPELREDAFRLFRESPDLGLVRDIANGSKHMVLRSYSVDGQASVAREYTGSGRPVRYVVPRAGGRNLDALQLAEVCIAKIREFMSSRQLS